MVRPDGVRAAPVDGWLANTAYLLAASRDPSLTNASRRGLEDEAVVKLARARTQLECAVEVLEEVVDRNIVGPHVRRELTLALEMLSHGWEDGERSEE